MKAIYVCLALFASLISSAQTKMYINKTSGTDSVDLNDLVSISFNSTPLLSKGIVFTSNRSGVDEIWFVKEDGTSLTKLTNGGATSKQYPRWSPDGKKVAYTAVIDGARKIFIITSDGTPLDTIATINPIQVYSICWTSEGNDILYSEAITCGERIRKVNLFTRKDSLLIDDAGIQQDPDEKNGIVAYRQGACGSTATINLFNRSTGMKTSITTTDETGSTPRWNNYGTNIVYFGGLNSEGRIITIKPDGSSKNKIITCVGHYPDFTSDEKIVFSRFKNDNVSASIYNIWIMDITGNNLKQLTFGEYSELYVDAF